MRIYTTILLSFVTNFVLAQNLIEISNDKYTSEFYKNLGLNLKKYELDSVQNSNEKIIRIWKGQEVYTLTKNSNYQRIFTNELNGLSYIYKKAFIETVDNIDIGQIKDLDVFYPIDCFPIAIEIVENNHYFVKVVGCNKEISSIINSIYNKEINNDIQKFIWNLPSGEYRDYMTTFTINQPIISDSDKTNLYKKIESELRDKNIEIEDPTKQPLIIINSETAYFEDINNISESKLKSYKILDKEEKRFLYGTKGNYGVILIETK